MEQEGRIFLTAGDASLGRHGNYGDSRGSTYSWDSTVSNSNLPQRGDLICVRSKQEILGVSLISEIVVEPSWKTRLRCVDCSSTKLKWSSKRRDFRCGSCSKQQAIPDVEFVDSLISTHAYYDWFFTPTPLISVEQVRKLSKTPKSIQSIQTLNLQSFLEILPNDALWRLGYVKLAGRFVRRENISLGRISSQLVGENGVCDITGLPGKGRLVNFDFVTFSTTNQKFSEIGSFKVLDLLGQQLQEGSCQIKLDSNEIQVEGFGDQASISFKIRSEATSILKWLTSYTGLYDDRIR